MKPDRSFARQIAAEHFHREKPTEWFDHLYQAAQTDASRIPWADQRPNTNLLAWRAAHPQDRTGRALVIGCGLGDDAEELARWGYKVTAFDVSPTAIHWCESRFPGSPVTYRVADLLDAPPEWTGAFDFILESYTLQALPPELRTRLIEIVASFVAIAGELLVICRARDEQDPPGDMPWPLTKNELLRFEHHGLRVREFEDYLDAEEEPPARRFRALFVRGGQ